MPQISKQRPVATIPPVKSAANGSILDRAVPVGSMKRAAIKLLMYGANRVGKNYLACQWPKPLLLVSCEPTEVGGTETIRKYEGVYVLQHGKEWQNTNELRALGYEIRDRVVAKKMPYVSIVFDSVTSLQDIVHAELLDLPRVPDQRDFGVVPDGMYQKRSEKTREMIRPFLDYPIDTIILGKEKDHNPPKEEKLTKSGKLAPDMRPKFLRGIQQASFIAADLGGATAGWLQDACDIVRLFVEEEMREVKTTLKGPGGEVSNSTWVPTGKYIRYLRMQYHPNYAAGIRSCTPDDVPEVMDNPTYEKIIKVLRG